MARFPICFIRQALLSYAACNTIGSTLRLHKINKFSSLLLLVLLLWSPWIANLSSRTSTVTYGFSALPRSEQIQLSICPRHFVNITTNAVVQRFSLIHKVVGPLRADDLQFLLESAAFFANPMTMQNALFFCASLILNAFRFSVVAAVQFSGIERLIFHVIRLPALYARQSTYILTSVPIVGSRYPLFGCDSQ